MFVFESHEFLTLSTCIFAEGIELGWNCGSDLVNLIEKMDLYARIAAEDLECERAFVNVKSGELLRSSGARIPADGVAVRSHVLGDTLCSRVIENEAALMISDARKSDEYREIAYVENGRIVGYLGVPITLPDYGVIGTLNMITVNPRDWTELELRYLERMGECIQYSIEGEISKSELDSINYEFNTQDKLVMFLASQIDDLFSVYDRSKNLLLASDALYKIAEYDCVADALTSNGVEIPDHGFGKQTSQNVQISCGGQSFDVKISQLSSGLTVCVWSVPVEKVH